MICSKASGHKGDCVQGDAGGCKKTASKWFAPVELPATGTEIEANTERIVATDDVYSQAEIDAMNEGQLIAAYRRTHVPSGRKEAAAWAREVIAKREA